MLYEVITDTAQDILATQGIDLGDVLEHEGDHGGCGSRPFLVVITSYSIHYTKLYEILPTKKTMLISTK